MANAEHIPFFSEMLLRINGIFTWIYHEDFELETTNCFYAELGAYQRRNDALFDALGDPVTLAQPTVLSDEIGLMWVCVRETTDEQERIFLLGPLLPADAPLSGLQQMIAKSAMSRAQQAEVLSFLPKVPTLSLMNIFQYAIMLAYTVNGQVVSLSDIVLPNDGLRAEQEGIETDSQKDARGNYAFENYFLKLVEDGNLQYEELLRNYAAIGDVGKLSNISALRNAQNTCIATVTLCSRAAMRGGLPPETAYSMSNFYIQAIDGAKSVSEVYAHHSAMLDDYIHRVNEYKQLQKNYTKLVADADAYIDLHLTDELSIESIAKALGYSKYYFSMAFKKCTGKTVNEHIRLKRLEYAKVQLRSTETEIAQISERLHFASPSYFTKCFREYTGMTPNVFRKTEEKS